MTLWDAACALGVGRKVTYPERERQRASSNGKQLPPSGPSSTLALRRKFAAEGRRLTEDDIPAAPAPLGVLNAALGLGEG